LEDVCPLGGFGKLNLRFVKPSTTLRQAQGDNRQLRVTTVKLRVTTVKLRVIFVN